MERHKTFNVHIYLKENDHYKQKIFDNFVFNYMTFDQLK